MSKFDEKEWYSAVFLANTMLCLPELPHMDISKNDLIYGAYELLGGLLDRAKGNQPTLSEKTKIIITTLNSFAVIDIAKNGGGVQ